MNVPELKPCPFCGGEAERITLEDDENFGGDVICCTDSQASSNVEFGFKENLVANWNRRAALPPTDAEIMAHPKVRALVEAAQWARNRLEIIADENWQGDARDFKRSLVGVFSDFDAALAAIQGAKP